MLFQKEFQLSSQNPESLLESIKGYWEGRGVIFTNVTENLLMGHRGSTVGNLLSFDMSQLITQVSISINSEGKVNCELDVNTKYQHITTWNRNYWVLELETFESVLSGNGYKQVEWQQYQKKSQFKNIIWSFQLTVVAVFGIALIKLVGNLWK